MFALIAIIFWILTAFLVGVFVGRFLARPVPVPLKDTHTYLSAVETMLKEEARSDRSKPVQKQPE